MAVDTRKALILRALTDPAFRTQLQESPAEALGVDSLSDVHRTEVRMILGAVRGIDMHIGAMADEILCGTGGGGGCGIAMA